MPRTHITKRRRYNVQLTVRQRRYIRGRIRGKTKLQSALDAGYSRYTALNALAKIESRAVRAAMERWFDREGISDQKLDELAEKKLLGEIAEAEGETDARNR